MYKPPSRYRNIRRGLLLLMVVLAMGTGGFVLIEQYSVLDAIYMTIITMSTVGFREVRHLGPDGQIFVIILIVSGLMVMTYTLSAIGQLVIEGQFYKMLGRRRMKREIDRLEGHFIICGHGRMGQILAQELCQEEVPFVAIEGDPELAEVMCDKGYLVIVGDATRDEILEEAGIGHAKGLVAVVSRDEDNLYITLSAREMTRQSNANLYILARAADESAMKKIKRAGADRVISPYQIGGMRMVQALLRPTVFDFVEVVTKSGGLDLMFEELKVGEGSSLVSTAIKDSGIRQKFDVITIAIKKPSGQMVFNPGPDYVIDAGDVLIILGDKEQMARLRQVLA